MKRKQVLQEYRLLNIGIEVLEQEKVLLEARINALKKKRSSSRYAWIEKLNILVKKF